MRVFDGHCDTISRFVKTGESLQRTAGHWSIGKAKAFTSYAQFFAAYSGLPERPEQSQFPIFLAQEALLEREVRANCHHMALCADAKSCQAAWAAGKVAAFLSVEGAELLDCDLDKLRQAYCLGVRAVNLTWNHANVLSGSNLKEPDRGLSDRGRDFVREMNKFGVLVDVSHLSDPGFWDVIRLTQAPVIASHSNSRALYFHPRNLTDDQFTAIMELSGTVGLTMAAHFLGDEPTLDTLVRVLEHFLDLGGEDTVALGGDWDGIDQAPAGVHDVTAWALFYRRLAELGYGQELLEKLFYKNLMRVVEQVCTTRVPVTPPSV